MRMLIAVWSLALTGAATAATPFPAQHVKAPKDLSRALDPNFSFRKFKIFTVSDDVPKTRGQKRNNPSDLSTRGSFKSKAGVQEASINFERAYRLYGAVTAYDQRQRHGEYFDFFWRSVRPAAVTILFEYKQEKLRAFVQAQQIDYQNARGTLHSAFRVVGDEYNDDGAILAWRCLLLEHGRIVAEKRSFLWE